MIKLVLLDADGTLFSAETGIPNSARKAIEEAKLAGIRFALCTGRPVGGFALGWARWLDPQGLHVFANGAAVIDAEGLPRYSEPLSNRAWKNIVHLARAHGIAVDAVIADGGRFHERGLKPPDLERHEKFIGVYSQERNLDEVMQVVHVWYVAGQQKWDTAREDIMNLPETRWLVYHAPDAVVAGTARKGITKAHGLSLLASHHGIDISKIAMIGDGDNDLEAIAAAGLGIAMGNAEDQVKQAADVVVGSLDQDGLSEAISFILENRR